MNDEVKIKVKKYNVAHDELFLKGKNGLYCLLPFERLDEEKKAVFKVGMTSQDLASRIENYHTYYPLGLYVCFFLSYPRLKKGQDRNALYFGMEKKLIQYLKDSGGRMLVYPSRPSKKSEWFYTSYKELQIAFEKVQAEYGGELSEYSLDGINKNYRTNMKVKNKYVGEIVYNVGIL